MAVRLTASAVGSIFQDCLASDQTPRDKRVSVEGLRPVQIVFNADALARHRPVIEAILNELPLEFREDVGGGMSFLHACNDRHGTQWTGEHRAMEQLFVLGFAIGKAEFKVPRADWVSLPGGMPYIVLK